MADLKLVGKPTSYDGDEDRWQEWSYTTKAYLIMAGLASGTWLNRLSRWETAVDEEEIPEQFREHSRAVYYILAMLCKGRALTIIRTVPEGNGFESWRRLCRRWRRP